MKILITILLLIASLAHSQTTVYVAPNGNDNNNGSIGSPFKTIYKGMDAVNETGGTVYLRGGTYVTANLQAGSTYLSTGLSGPSLANPIKVWAYPGESPVIDMSASSELWVFYFTASAKYYHFKGFEIKNFEGYALDLQGKGYIFERLVIHEGNHVGNAAIQGRPPDGGGVGADSVTILNCDIYDMFDEPDGESANAIGACGAAWLVKGCRIWGISDDGMDFWEADTPVRLDSVWILGSGLGTAGDGMGLKLGGSASHPNARHVITNCITAYNRANGMHQNTQNAGMYIYNCSSYKDGYGWNFNYASANPHTLKNNIVYAPRLNSTLVWLNGGTVTATNSWSGFTVTDADFVSLDTTGMRGPRGPNGELPYTNFMRLVEGSDLAGAGTPVGIPYPGSKPNLGAVGAHLPPDPIGPPPAAPVLIRPSDGATIDPAAFTVRWHKVIGAAKYQLQLAENSTFLAPLLSDSTVTDTVRQVSSLLGGSTYFIRVRAAGTSSGWGNYSATVQFMTTATPPTVIEPKKGSKGTPISFKARWNKSHGATSYRIQIDDDSTFQSPGIDDPTVVDTVRQIAVLEPNTRYYCRVRAKVGSTYSPYSAVSDFVTGNVSSTDDEQPRPLTFSLMQNFPNPFNPSTTIRFSLPVNSTVRLTLFNTLGQGIRNLVDGELRAGLHEVTLDAAGLASGIYYYRLQTDEYLETKKLSLLK